MKPPHVSLRGAVVIAALLVSACGNEVSDDAPNASEDQATSTTAAETPESRCVDLWNEAGTDESYGKQEITSVSETLEERSGSKTLYVTVGFDATFPDRCLITFASPDLGVAYQWRESTDARGGPYTSAGGGTIDDLPESVTDWNARTDGDANVLEGPP